MTLLFLYAKPLEIVLLCLATVGAAMSFYVLYRAYRRMANLSAHEINGYIYDRAITDWHREGTKAIIQVTALTGSIALLFLQDFDSPQVKFMLVMFMLLVVELFFSTLIAFLSIRRHQKMFDSASKFKRRYTDLQEQENKDDMA